MLALTGAVMLAEFGGAVAAPRNVEITREQGIEFCTVRSAGNAGWTGTPNDYLAGRGKVDYDYRIGRTEITTAQWMEFVNTFGPQDEQYRLDGAIQSGFTFDVGYTGPGYRVVLNPFLPNAAQQPVVGITWYNAARYCNWLHNGKSSSLLSLDDGAYDTRTWGRNPDNTLRDQPHKADAKYWIPTMDEWMKATYFDPVKEGESRPGWWMYPNQSDVTLLPGAAENGGQTSAGYPWLYPNLPPLGAYPDQMSAWGLLDTSGGGGKEWTDEFLSNSQPYWHCMVGSARGDALDADMIGVFDIGGSASLRIATSIPAPSSLWMVFALGLVKRRRA
jgi:sulfatase modifying factor 1